jgi:hypothetical protein
MAALSNEELEVIMEEPLEGIQLPCATRALLPLPSTSKDVPPKSYTVIPFGEFVQTRSMRDIRYLKKFCFKGYSVRRFR